MNLFRMNQLLEANCRCKFLRNLDYQASVFLFSFDRIKFDGGLLFKGIEWEVFVLLQGQFWIGAKGARTTLGSLKTKVLSRRGVIQLTRFVNLLLMRSWRSGSKTPLHLHLHQNHSVKTNSGLPGGVGGGGVHDLWMDGDVPPRFRKTTHL